jgi:hypothetical protein
VQASGVQTKAQNAHVDVERVSHGKLNIASNAVATIAAKAHMTGGDPSAFQKHGFWFLKSDWLDSGARRTAGCRLE